MASARSYAVVGGIVLCLAGLLGGAIQALLATQLPVFWNVKTLIGLGASALMLVAGIVTIARASYGFVAGGIGTASSGLWLLGTVADLMGGFVPGMVLGIVGGVLATVGSYRHQGRDGQERDSPQTDEGATSTD